MPRKQARPTRRYIEPQISIPHRSWGSIFGLLPVVLTVGGLIAAGGVFYGVSTYRGDRTDKAIEDIRRDHATSLIELKSQIKDDLSAIKSQQEQQAPAIASRLETERLEREKVREAFIQNSNKTTELLGQMNTRLAVGEQKQESMNKTLELSNATLSKIADELRRINVRPDVR